jgi:hypothetical protein
MVVLPALSSPNINIRTSFLPAARHHPRAHARARSPVNNPLAPNRAIVRTTRRTAVVARHQRRARCKTTLRYAPKSPENSRDIHTPIVAEQTTRERQRVGRKRGWRERCCRQPTWRQVRGAGGARQRAASSECTTIARYDAMLCSAHDGGESRTDFASSSAHTCTGLPRKCPPSVCVAFRRPERQPQRRRACA